MNKANTMTVHFDKKYIQQALIATPIMVVVALYLLMFIQMNPNCVLLLVGLYQLIETYFYRKTNAKEIVLLRGLIVIALIIISVPIQMKLSSFLNDLSHASFLVFLILLAIKIMLYTGIALFIVCFLYVFFSFHYKGPAAVLNDTGIWVRYFGFISWDNITKCVIYHIRGAPHTELIGIMLKHRSAVSKQSNLSGKIGLFWANLFGTYHITISNITVPCEEVVAFANRSMKHIDK